MKKYQAAEVLKSAFLRLKKQNPGISIRGLATKMDLSHVFLSKILSGHAPVPEARLQKIIKVFQLDPFAVRELKESMVSDLASTEKIDKIFQRTHIRNKKQAAAVYEEHTIKHQVVLENWYELPILDYLTCEDLPQDIESIAKTLDIKPSAVILTLKKLSDSKLIARDDSGQWIKTAKFLRFPASTPSAVLQKYYTDILKRTAAELKKTTQEDYDRRLIINFSVATQKDKIPEIKEKLSQFLYNLTVEMAEGPSNEVYQLTLGLVPMTRSMK